MNFLILVRALGIGVAAGLICNLLYSAGKKRMKTGQQSKSGSRRKYVESSVIEKKDEPPESDQKNY